MVVLMVIVDESCILDAVEIIVPTQCCTFSPMLLSSWGCLVEYVLTEVGRMWTSHPSHPWPSVADARHLYNRNIDDCWLPMQKSVTGH